VVPIHRRVAGNPNNLKMAVGIIKSSVVNEPASFACRVNIDTNRFDDLVLALRQALGPSSGLTSDDVDVDHLDRLMRDYDSDPREWSRFAMGDESRGYTRNLVDEGNGKSNLVGQPPFGLFTLPLTDDNSLSSSGRLARAAQSTTTATPTA
jgi:hypothetical protein